MHLQASSVGVVFCVVRDKQKEVQHTQSDTYTTVKA